jgi:hypothetical protein
MMIRKLQTLGLALMALFALSAMVASTASAAEQGKLTSDGEVTLTAADAPGTLTTFTAFGLKTECNATYTGHTYNVTPHTRLTSGETTITVTPTYKNCTGILKAGGGKVAETVTMNGCDLVIHIEKTVVMGKWNASTDIVCPADTFVEIHAYTSAAHTSTLCTYKIKGQTGRSGAFFENLTPSTVTIGGPIKGINVKKEGLTCGGMAETNEGEVDLDLQVAGLNAGGAATEIQITD